MIPLLLDVGIIALTFSTMLMVARIILGPTLPDRVAAVDGATTHIIALIVLVAMKIEVVLLFDIAIALSILSFLVSLVTGKYLEKGSIIDDVSDR